MQFLVDTNVFLDFLLHRDSQSDDANLFFIKSRMLNNPIFITSMTLRDIEYVAARLLHSKEKAKKIQILAYQMCQKVIGISASDAIEALYSDGRDYEDSLIIEAAKTSLVDAIITNNKKDFNHANIPVFTPKEINGYL